MIFIIDSVLEPLLTNSIRNASFNQDITAGKLLARYILHIYTCILWRLFSQDFSQNGTESNLHKNYASSRVGLILGTQEKWGHILGCIMCIQKSIPPHQLKMLFHQRLITVRSANRVTNQVDKSLQLKSTQNNPLQSWGRGLVPDLLQPCEAKRAGADVWSRRKAHFLPPCRLRFWGGHIFWQYFSPNWVYDVPAALFELYRVHLQGNCTNITLDVRAVNWGWSSRSWQWRRWFSSPWRRRWRSRWWSWRIASGCPSTWPRAPCVKCQCRFPAAEEAAWKDLRRLFCLLLKFVSSVFCQGVLSFVHLPLFIFVSLQNSGSRWALHLRPQWGWGLEAVLEASCLEGRWESRIGRQGTRRGWWRQSWTCFDRRGSWCCR